MEPENAIESVIHEAELDDRYALVLQKEKDIAYHLQKIKEHYILKKMCHYDKCESTAKQLLMTILADPELSEIHSARYRVKSLESLWTKYIKKKALLPENSGADYNIEKYRPMAEDNYYKIITDLIGIRILIRYQQQWEVVHKWIWTNFYKLDKPYIKNWLTDYPSGEDDFLVEKPKIYLREENDRLLYQKFGKDIFEFHVSNAGYNSIHYLLWYDGKYVEIQVRTIYDEAWSECTHDLVYKCKNKASKVDLERLAVILATQTQAAGMLADLMFEKAQPNEQRNNGEISFEKNMPKLQDDKYEKLQKQIRSISSLQKDDLEFDGAIDDLIC